MPFIRIRNRRKTTSAQFELIPCILHVLRLRKQKNPSPVSISSAHLLKNLPLAQLHWIIADASGAITVESTADGLHVYDNPVGVLTNNPPFPKQMFSLTITCICHRNSLRIVFQPARSFYVQPRHGWPRTSRGPLFCFPLWTRGVCKAELISGNSEAEASASFSIF